MTDPVVFYVNAMDQLAEDARRQACADELAEYQGPEWLADQDAFDLYVRRGDR